VRFGGAGAVAQAAACSARRGGCSAAGTSASKALSEGHARASPSVGGGRLLLAALEGLVVCAVLLCAMMYVLCCHALGEYTSLYTNYYEFLHSNFNQNTGTYDITQRDLQ
jgi:hypothetical protein